jgi:hypothetical protein
LYITGKDLKKSLPAAGTKAGRGVCRTENGLSATDTTLRKNHFPKKAEGLKQMGFHTYYKGMKTRDTLSLVFLKKLKMPKNGQNPASETFCVKSPSRLIL